MIIYSPLDGHPIQRSIKTQPKHCFLMTRLGKPVPKMVEEMRKAVQKCCKAFDYKVIDAQTRVTGRDVLLKIWNIIASTPLSVGILQEDIPQSSQTNIFYELGVAQALGKETLVIKSPKSKIPSDLIRTEYIVFDDKFSENFKTYLESIFDQANYYETMADQLDRNPILALDYLKRAYLITGEDSVKRKVPKILDAAKLEDRARDSVEWLAATF